MEGIIPRPTATAIVPIGMATAYSATRSVFHLVMPRVRRAHQIRPHPTWVLEAEAATAERRAITAAAFQAAAVYSAVEAQASAALAATQAVSAEAAASEASAAVHQEVAAQAEVIKFKIKTRRCAW